ncbi:MAG: hypothetical protein ACTHMM_07095 [Agriterribacter sp.]
MEQTVIPDNKRGKENDLHVKRALQTRGEARRVFVRACKRLLNPKVWSELAGNEKAEFTLVDRRGKKLHRLIREKDFIKINIPGPGPGAGEGFDWVQVGMIDDLRNRDLKDESLAMRLDVCGDPTRAENETAHFFKEGASSSFQVARSGNQLAASYHGRNEQINNDTDNTGDNIRNTLVGAGAMLGFSELQWSALIRALLEDEIGG